MRALWVAALAAVVLVIAGCGGGDEDGTSLEGEAALAVSQFWIQERDGGLLPDGPDAIERGAQQIVTLDTQDQQARVCVQYVYTVAVEPFETKRRVYVATKNDDLWAVEVVNPNGTCDEVT